MGLTQNGLARAIGVPPRRINEIVLGKRSVTADTDLRLSRYFTVSEGFWLGLQADHDLLQRRRQIGEDLDRIEPRVAAGGRWEIGFDLLARLNAKSPRRQGV